MPQDWLNIHPLILEMTNMSEPVSIYSMLMVNWEGLLGVWLNMKNSCRPRVLTGAGDAPGQSILTRRGKAETRSKGWLQDGVETRKNLNQGSARTNPCPTKGQPGWGARRPKPAQTKGWEGQGVANVGMNSKLTSKTSRRPSEDQGIEPDTRDCTETCPNCPKNLEYRNKDSKIHF